MQDQPITLSYDDYDLGLSAITINQMHNENELKNLCYCTCITPVAHVELYIHTYLSYITCLFLKSDLISKPKDCRFLISHPTNQSSRTNRPKEFHNTKNHKTSRYHCFFIICHLVFKLTDHT